VLEDHENAEMLVRREAMFSVRRHEDCTALSHWHGLTLDLENARALENHVQLVVLVRLLPIRLWGDEHIDAHFEAGGVVDDLIATAGLP
jgi:hypothetical protein